MQSPISSRFVIHLREQTLGCHAPLAEPGVSDRAKPMSDPQSCAEVHGKGTDGVQRSGQR